jgi:ArsR family transcriptional regulator
MTHAKDPKDFRKQARLFKALAHPTRLMIIDSLLKGEKCVGDIQDLLKSSQPNVSQHLSILKACGIVDFCQQGNLRCYHLKDPERIQVILESLS